MAKRNPRKSKNRSEKRRGGANTAPGNPWLFGLHAVTAALLNENRRVERLVVTLAGHERLPEAALETIRAEFLGREDMDDRSLTARCGAPGCGPFSARHSPPPHWKMFY